MSVVATGSIVGKFGLVLTEEKNDREKLKLRLINNGDESFIHAYLVHYQKKDEKWCKKLEPHIFTKVKVNTNGVHEVIKKGDLSNMTAIFKLLVQNLDPEEDFSLKGNTLIIHKLDDDYKEEIKHIY